MITKCAIRRNGRIYKGDTHQDVIYLLITRYKVKSGPYGEEGFINEKGKFFSREDAAIEAIRCGQITELKYSRDMLFAEDLREAEPTFTYRLLTSKEKKQKH